MATLTVLDCGTQG